MSQYSTTSSDADVEVIAVEARGMPDTGLQTAAHEELLETISALRAQGVGRYIDLPQLMVCGDQSAGKSSVLEAVSGLRFPSKDTACTRFATELILQRGNTSSVNISIIPSEDRPAKEKRKLLSFQAPENALENFAALVESAGKIMGVGSHFKKKFTADILRIEVCGATQPHLLMVDLPGLIRIGSDEEVALVRDLVKKYMVNPRTIILTVIAANYDIDLQEIVKLAQTVDPANNRTLGFITKPDLLQGRPGLEQSFVEKVKAAQPGYGWHVLRNRKDAERDFTSPQRDSAEQHFFQEGVWNSVSPTRLGIKSLKPKLSNILLEKISAELPSLVQDVESALGECQKDLESLPESMGDPRQRRRRLRKIGKQVEALLRAGCEGKKEGELLIVESTKNAESTTVKEYIQRIVDQFSDDMRNNGHTYPELQAYFTGNLSEARRRYLAEITGSSSMGRKREVEGNVNPQTVVDLFQKQSERWNAIILSLVERVAEAASVAVAAALQREAGQQISDGLMPSIEEYVEAIKQSLDKEARKAMYRRDSVCSSDRDFVNVVGQIRTEYRQRVLRTRLGTYFQVSPASTAWSSSRTASINLHDLAESLDGQEYEDQTEAETIACMQAFYEKTVNTVIDDLGMSTIDRYLLSALPEVFSAELELWNDLDDEMIEGIAGENAETMMKRKAAEEKRRVLKIALDKLRKLDAIKRQAAAPRKRPHRLISQALS